MRMPATVLLSSCDTVATMMVPMVSIRPRSRESRRRSDENAGNGAAKFLRCWTTTMEFT